MTFKKVIGKIHLWLGLSSGLVVFIVAVTGCIYAFQEEIKDATEDYRFVEEKNEAFLKPSEFKKIAEKQIPNHHVHSVNYLGKGHAVEVNFYEPEPLFYTTVYLDPYSGKVLKTKDLTYDFFYQVLQGHFYLWLPAWIGQPLVASFTLIFVVMMISGIILWWPRNKNARKQRFKFDWKETTKKKRKNYDLHSIFGFYASIFALVLALTGLVWGFQWFASSVHKVAGGEKSLMYSEPESGKNHSAQFENPSDEIWYRLQKQYKGIAAMEVHFPETETSPIYVYIKRDEGTFYRADYRFFDQYTLKELEVDHIYGKYADATAADKLIRMNYDIHVGQIGGLPGKILAFIISLIVASLPITGFCIWLWRKKSKATEKDERKLAAKNVLVPEKK